MKKTYIPISVVNIWQTSSSSQNVYEQYIVFEEEAGHARDSALEDSKIEKIGGKNGPATRE